MKYPTLQQVKSATHEQLDTWNRFLGSPGKDHVSSPNFTSKYIEENKVMSKIRERFRNLTHKKPDQAQQNVNYNQY